VLDVPLGPQVLTPVEERATSRLARAVLDVGP